MVKTRAQSRRTAVNTDKTVVDNTKMIESCQQQNIEIRLVKGEMRKTGQQTISKTNKQICQEREVAKSYRCSICLELMIYPTLAVCGHASCLPCFEESLKYKKSCSVCRQSLPFCQLKPSTLLTNIISVFKNKLQINQLQSYAQRVNNFVTKQQIRSIGSDIKIGDSIDYCKNWMWYEGTVASIDVNSQNKATIKVQSRFNNSQYTDFQVNSRWIAKHKHFTLQTNGNIRRRAAMMEINSELNIQEDWVFSDILSIPRVPRVPTISPISAYPISAYEPDYVLNFFSPFHSYRSIY